MEQIHQDYNWTLNCITSCTNTWQLECAYIIIMLFKLKHNDELLTNLLVQEYITVENKFMVL